MRYDLYSVLLPVPNAYAEKQMLCYLQNIQLGLLNDVYSLGAYTEHFCSFAFRNVVFVAFEMGNYIQKVPRALLSLHKRMPFMRELQREALRS